MRTLMMATVFGCAALTALAQEVPVILLINPNSNDSATESMAALAQDVAGERARIVGVSNAGAPALLKTEADMATASTGVVALGQAGVEGAAPAAIIVSAFSDPGLEPLRDAVETPVFGIGESVFQEAGANGRPFAIVTITPDQGLIDSFAARAEGMGLAGHYLGTFVTPGDPEALLNDANALDAALATAASEAKAAGAEAIIMGGGPLSAPARRIQSNVELPLLVAVDAATRAALAEIGVGD